MSAPTNTETNPAESFVLDLSLVKDTGFELLPAGVYTAKIESFDHQIKYPDAADPKDRKPYFKVVMTLQDDLDDMLEGIPSYAGRKMFDDIYYASFGAKLNQLLDSVHYNRAGNGGKLVTSLLVGEIVKIKVIQNSYPKDGAMKTNNKVDRYLPMGEGIDVHAHAPAKPMAPTKTKAKNALTNSNKNSESTPASEAHPISGAAPAATGEEDFPF